MPAGDMQRVEIVADLLHHLENMPDAESDGDAGAPIEPAQRIERTNRASGR